MKRMYGDFEMNPGYGSGTSEPGHRTRGRKRSREAQKYDSPDGGPRERNIEIHVESESDEGYFSKRRNTRQSPDVNNTSESGR